VPPAATLLPPPPADRAGAEAWVAEHLGDLAREGPGGVQGSPRFRGGQAAADAALALWDVAAYARRRNEVWPEDRRGASGLSPYIRYGLIGLRELWAAAAGGPARDVAKFRDELLWQEYARHLHARLGHDSARALRHAPARAEVRWPEPWPREMACVDLTVGELERDGWLVNQTRMWLASQWTVRAGHEWTAGEDAFFVHLLDGSRAANRVGWQWTIGAGTGKPYGFSRWQVRKRAPGLCERCALRDACPIEDWPEARPGPRVEPPARLRADPDPSATGGPRSVEPGGSASGAPAEAVWLTGESLGDADPALTAHPELPAVFVWDAPLLARWRLSGKRLVFLAETLGDLAARRRVEVHRGVPTEVLAGRPLATTFAPVPGFRARAARLDVAELHPWPWLVPPHGGPAGSFSAWRRAARR
jgi:deoxyribodipyrimidine photo-lyase